MVFSLYVLYTNFFKFLYASRFFMSYCFQDIKGQNGANTQNLEFFISCPVLLVLAHLSQRVLSTPGIIVIVCKRYILIFFSETTGPIGNKFRRNLYWIIL